MQFNKTTTKQVTGTKYVHVYNDYQKCITIVMHMISGDTHGDQLLFYNVYIITFTWLACTI